MNKAFLGILQEEEEEEEEEAMAIAMDGSKDFCLRGLQSPTSSS